MAQQSTYSGFENVIAIEIPSHVDERLRNDSPRWPLALGTAGSVDEGEDGEAFCKIAQIGRLHAPTQIAKLPAVSSRVPKHGYEYTL